MSRRRRGSARRPAANRPSGAGASVPRQRVKPGAPTARRSIQPVWLLVAAVAGVAALALFVLFGPRLSGGPGAAASPSATAASLPASSGASAVTGVSCPNSQPPPLAAGEKRIATIETELGTIEITLEADLSPIAVGNFVALGSCGYYDDVVFHRAATLQDGTPFVIQGGDPTGTGGGGPGYQIQDEPVTQPYRRGTVAMARTPAPNSVGSQFFIVLHDDAGPVLQSANTYQIIGTVSAGMETADAIYAAAGGVENPSDPVTMTRVTVRTP